MQELVRIIISSKMVSENANSAFRDNLDHDSDRTDGNDLNLQKHYSPMASTNAGIMRSIKPVAENARFSVRDNIDYHSMQQKKVMPNNQSSPRPRLQPMQEQRDRSIRPAPYNAHSSILPNLRSDSKCSRGK
jgi:hypothetical protein